MNSDFPGRNNYQEISDNSFFDFSISDEFVETSNSARASAENEYYAYLSDSSTSIEMLNRYRTIKKACLKYNTPLPSSAAVGTHIFICWMLNIPRRGALSDTNFAKLLLLKVNNLNKW